MGKRSKRKLLQRAIRSETNSCRVDWKESAAIRRLQPRPMATVVELMGSRLATGTDGILVVNRQKPFFIFRRRVALASIVFTL